VGCRRSRAGAAEAELLDVVHPSRRPATKAHTSLGYANAAISPRLSDFRGAAEDMSIQELNPATGKYATLFTVPKGTPKSQMPW
jgi:hypothetical protein